MVYFKPDPKSAESLKSLLLKTSQALEGKIKNVFEGHGYTISDYTPHLTIAEKIPQEELLQIKKETSGFKRKIEFEVNCLYLYRQKENSKNWKELARVRLL